MVIINLKESFRYHTFLDSNITALSYYIKTENNVVKLTEVHQKSKSNNEAVDETVDMTTERTYTCKVEDIAYLVKQLIEEKLKLSLAIENAKKNIVLDWQEDGKNLTLDSAVEFNKQIRSMIANLRYLVDLKSTEFKKSGSDFKFNVNGDQVAYRYNIDVKKEIDFDRNKVRELYKKLVSKADIISTQIDEAMLKDCVNYTPIYDLHDSTVEIVEAYIANKG
jgi:hypothetical protein